MRKKRDQFTTEIRGKERNSLVNRLREVKIAFAEDFSQTSLFEVSKMTSNVNFFDPSQVFERLGQIRDFLEKEEEEDLSFVSRQILHFVNEIVQKHSPAPQVLEICIEVLESLISGSMETKFDLLELKLDQKILETLLTSQFSEICSTSVDFFRFLICDSDTFYKKYKQSLYFCLFRKVIVLHHQSQIIDDIILESCLQGILLISQKSEEMNVALRDPEFLAHCSSFFEAKRSAGPVFSFLELMNQICSIITIEESENLFAHSSMFKVAVEVLSSDLTQSTVKISALKIARNLATTSEKITDQLSQSNAFMSCLMKSLTHPDSKIVRKEALKCLCSLCANCSETLCRFLIDTKVFEHIIANLEEVDEKKKSKKIYFIGKAIFNVLLFDNRMDLHLFKKYVENSNLIGTIAEWQNDSSQKVFHIATEIIQTFFEELIDD